MILNYVSTLLCFTRFLPLLTSELTLDENFTIDYAKTEDIVPFIIDGFFAKEGEFPYIVALLYKIDENFKHSCGGSIISSSFVLTASHCVHNINRNHIIILYGQIKLTSDERYTIPVFKIFIHPSSANSYFSHDIALIQLDGKLEFSDRVKPIILPEKIAKVNDECIVTGWGTTVAVTPYDHPIYLKAVNVSLSDQCIGDNFNNNTMLCVIENKGGGCTGDSGGPMVCHGILTGITSSGVCQDFGIYTNVYYYRSWIIDVMNKSNSERSSSISSLHVEFCFKTYLLFYSFIIMKEMYCLNK